MIIREIDGVLYKCIETTPVQLAKDLQGMRDARNSMQNMLNMWMGDDQVIEAYLTEVKKDEI